MALIPGTNIIVDKFRPPRNDLNNYVFFLSHIHTDHIEGLHNSWDHGRIYMSKRTRALLLDKYPGLKSVAIELTLNEEHWIFLDDEQKSEGITAVLLDANHCPGAVMMLFKGKMGNVLHTGDFRFHKKFLKYSHLFPPEKANEEGRDCAIHLDHVIMDGTFATPLVKFPTQEIAYRKIIQIIS